MEYFKRFLLMIQFLTTIPLKVNLNVTQEDFGKGLVFAPLAGLIIGGILSGIYYILISIFPVYVTVVFTIVIYILLTGGLHLDGLGDTFDGLFSNRPKERILEIMRDSRVGTNAVLAILCVLLLNIGLLAELKHDYALKVLVLMPVAGRIGSLIGSGVSTYARSGEGLGKSFIDYCGVREMVAGSLIYLAVFWGIGKVTGAVIAVLPILTAFLLVKFFSRKIGGATGDILGAVCELNQTAFLIIMYFAQVFGYRV